MKMEAIAKDNQISVKKVKNLVHGEVAKKPRKAQLHNAILHAKSLEINEGTSKFSALSIDFSSDPPL